MISKTPHSPSIHLFAGVIHSRIDLRGISKKKLLDSGRIKSHIYRGGGSVQKR
jgi:hypothetical protein